MAVLRVASRAYHSAAMSVLFAAFGSFAACSPGAGGGASATASSIAYTGPAPKESPLVAWPKAKGEQQVPFTIKVAGSFNGEMQRFYGVDDLGTSNQNESQQPLFKLSEGAVLENVIIGHPAADGIHCKGSCTLRNVWWENVGEDAATFRGNSPGDVMLIEGGGASGARDKVFQSNRQGTVHIKDFYIEWFGKLFRSCGNCSQQNPRHVIIENVTAIVAENTKTLAGININYGDTAEFRGETIIYARPGLKFTPCLTYQGTSNNSKEPKELGPGQDGAHCKALASHVTVRSEYEPKTESVASAAPTDRN